MKQSAGILLYRWRPSGPEVFLVHPGGPFFARKDAGSWTIPKGEPAEGEELLAAAWRELEEETGVKLQGRATPLRPIRQKGGKLVHCWMVEGDLDETAVVSNTFEIQWPPRSGRMQSFPEIDRAAWFSPDQAREKINEQQQAFIDEWLAWLEKENQKL